jgi:hypothetical protein
MAIKLLSVLLALGWHAAASPTSLDKRASIVPALSASCNLNNAALPKSALPPPSAGLSLSHVAIGRGTQNYTCADSTAASIPVQVGAMASLYNATCLAAESPLLLNMLPGIALEFPVPAATDVAANAFLSGHHYFLDKTTPFFNLDTAQHSWGTAACAKGNSSNAPNPTKDVPWLMLTVKSADGCTLSQVYRVNTVGGVAPANCAGQPATVLVDYAAEYWMFSNTAPGGY